jgi:AcrR family transcriptional regulator
MPRYSEKRRAALEGAMQDEVLRAATAILRSEGLVALTMDRIARDVGVSRGTLYNYFADADAVLNFVESRTIEPITTAIVEIAKGNESAPEKLAAVARTMLDGLYRDHALAMALFAKQELQGPRAEHKIARRNRFLEIVRGIVAEGVARGELRSGSPAVAAELFLGTIGGLIDTMMYSGKFRTADDLVPALMEFVLRGLEPCPDNTG